MKKRAAVVLMLGLMPWAGLYAGQPAQTTFKVSAKVEAVCEVTASDLNFGTYSWNVGTVQGTTQLTATCTPGSTYSVGLNEGASTGAAVNQRKMVSGSNALDYQLYSDSARSTIWGNTNGTDTVTGSGTGSAVGHTVYGSVPAGQSIPVGDYGDVITVRVYY
jgi:spore coat protein U-like protein